MLKTAAVSRRGGATIFTPKKTERKKKSLSETRRVQNRCWKFSASNFWKALGKTFLTARNSLSAAQRRRHFRFLSAVS